MRIYSNILSRADLERCLPPQVAIWDIDETPRPRRTKYAYTVYLQGLTERLSDGSKRRRVNSGEHGAGYHLSASYDEHGEWMARLFTLDPDARISLWKNREHFDAGTQGRYSGAAV